jgi:prepilin-type N-terminal cleavage/methylation domain-containing protein
VRRERGFTLIEVLIALTIGGMLVLLAHHAFGATLDLSLALQESRAAHEEDMEARRQLGAFFASADASADGAAGFHGTPTRIVFSSWTHDGLRTVDLSVFGGRLVALTGADTIRLMRATAFSADYLLAYGASTAWVQEWQSPVSAPLAVRLRIARAAARVDTMLLVIGPRG